MADGGGAGVQVTTEREKLEKPGFQSVLQRIQSEEENSAFHSASPSPGLVVTPALLKKSRSKMRKLSSKDNLAAMGSHYHVLVVDDSLMVSQSLIPLPAFPTLPPPSTQKHT